MKKIGIILIALAIMLSVVVVPVATAKPVKHSIAGYGTFESVGAYNVY